MTLENLGYNADLENFRNDENLASFLVGRVISEHKERYVVKTDVEEYDCELIGNLRFTAESRYDLPAVGDWVAFSEYDEGKALIHAIYPRKSIIKRQAPGKATKIQIIATNVDFGLIVQAVDRDFNLNRLERYMTICNAAGVEPIIVLNKVDLISDSDLERIKKLIDRRISEVRVITTSNITKGYDDLESVIIEGSTYCLLGSSGVGKSTILNNLTGKYQMKTGEISASVNKGRHITSHRELIILDNGGILIDNPGMREVGIADSTLGLESTFDFIMDCAERCRFKDCTHTQEVDCAVLAAVEEGEIEQAAYDNFLKMVKEKEHFELSALERKRKDKDFGKMIKNVLKEKKKNKF
jgi:ribosome biogenesis GTPase